MKLSLGSPRADCGDRQVMKDLQTLTTLAEEDGDDDEPRSAWSEWQAMAHEFWQPKKETDKKVRGLFRKNVFRWLKTTAHALQVAVGRHWGAFLIEDDAGPPAAWPSISCSCDQGGDGWSALHYLLATQHNVLPLMDASHRAWNDAQLALNSSGLKWVVLATTICLNTDNGPWSSQRWFALLQEAAEHWLGHIGEQDPVFDHLRLQLKEELCGGDVVEEFNMTDEDMWLNVPLAVSRKTNKVATTRWFQYVVSVSVFMRTRVRRLLLSLFVSLQLGLFKHGRASDMVKVKVPSDKSGEDIPKATTGMDQPEVQSMRRACSNTFSFTTSLLADGHIWKLNRIIAEVLSPLQHWHSSQNRGNRSPVESLRWWCEMASGQGFTHINETVSKMQDRDLFKALHIEMGHNLLLKELDNLDEVSIDAQNELCEFIGTLGIEVICRRLRTISEHTAPPYNFAGLIGADAASVLENVKEAWDLWEEMRTYEGSFWKKLQARSRMRWQKVKQVVLLCRHEHEWRVSDGARAIVAQDFGGISQTKAVEDGVRVCKTALVNKGHNSKIADARCWETLIHSDVLHSKHRFPPLPWQQQPVPQGLGSRCTSNLYHVQPGGVPKTWKKVVSTNPKARLLFCCMKGGEGG